MGNILFMSVISFFAVTGVYMMIREFFACPQPEDVTLRVRNCENDIEYTLRALLWRYPSSRITVEDMNSTDNTVEIARKFAEKHTRVCIKEIL